ncbi:MAG: phage Gp37/Gp68 family protein [Pseudomonadales bacterium]|nr:MAG: phage Gp37/Gp68 family protein [Pseudomonadales bacterium]
MATSKIEWTEMTWNPVTGCTKISTGCKNCYAEIMSSRLKAMGTEKYTNGFDLTLHPQEINTPRRWKKPRTIFVNSMSDLFHKGVPDEFILEVFSTMRECPQHHFQVLTKRANRLRRISKKIAWPENVWMGVSVEDKRRYRRIEGLCSSDAKVKFLSLEPLLGPLPDLPLSGIDWVIVGGESGPKARPLDRQWVIDIRDQCIETNVPFFFKQWGGTNKKRNGRELDGQIYDEMPVFSAA